MKEWWGFIVVCGATVAGLAFWAGAVSVTGASPDVAPHGVAEYWFFRYQTVIASIIALGGAAFVLLQMRASSEQHRANIRLALRHEYDALDSAEKFGEHMIRSADYRDLDVVSALLRQPRTRVFRPIDPARLGRIQQWSGDVVSEYIAILLDAISEYERWRNAGSIVETNVLGSSTPTFEARMEKIINAGIVLAELSKMRRMELDKFGGKS